MEDEQEKKQQFLREEILDKNYDPQLFINFLIMKKGESAEDINNWTLDELNSIVIEFKKSQNNKISPKKEPSSNIDIISKEEESKQKEKEKKKHNIISYLNEETNNEWLFMNLESESNDSSNNNGSFISENSTEHKIIEIDCLEPDQTPLSKYEKVNIRITSPKEEYESKGLKGFFMKTIYYTFLMENKELKINRRRRYTDFEWLRKTLLKLYPGYYIPPLPLKSINVSKFEKLEKYQRYLQRFIDGIMEDKLLKNSSILYLFIFTEKENDLISLMNKYDNLQKPKDLKYFYSREGKIILDENVLSNKKKQKLKKIKDVISKHNNLFSNLNQSLKNLCKEMKQVSDRMLEISNLFKEIYTESINYSHNNNYVQYYSNLELFFKEYSKKELKQIKNISIELKQYLKYVNLKYISSMKELYDNFEYEHNLYCKVAKNLREKKEFLYANGPIEKWELSDKDKNIDIKNKEEVIKKILPKDTAIVYEIKKYLIYYATQLDNEMLRVKESIEKQNKKAFKIFIDKNSDISGEYNKFIESMKDKDKIMD